MTTRSLIFEGSGKNLYTGSSPEQVILEFKEYVTDKKSNKKTKIKGKGSTNTAISINLFEYLSSYNVQNHFISKVSENEIKVKNLEIIPIEVFIRNYATGDFCKK
ncbi:phosphoribosylaminoimidazolesuccinocarboxamide synthase, partial [Calditrichota bacterium]